MAHHALVPNLLSSISEQQRLTCFKAGHQLGRLHPRDVLSGTLYPRHAQLGSDPAC